MEAKGKAKAGPAQAQAEGEDDDDEDGDAEEKAEGGEVQVSAEQVRKVVKPRKRGMIPIAQGEHVLCIGEG